MNHLKRLLGSATLLALLLVTAAMPAAAQHGADDTTGGTSGTTTTPTTVANETETSTTTDSSVKTERQKLAEDKQSAKEDKAVTQAEHEKRCESHKQGLNTRADKIVTNAQRAQDRIGGILDKAVAYQQANNVTVANWDSLLAAANSAKADSAAAIANLQTVKPTIDCNSTSVASDVSAFKTAAAKTRDSLKAYRSAVRAVVQALQAAKTTTTEGSQQ